MKQKDYEVLCELRNDSRETLTTMSKRTGIPISTLHDKIKQFKKNHLIKKSTIIINYPRLGYNARALQKLKVNPSQKKKLLSNLLVDPNCNNIWQINNGFDFIADIIYKDLNQFESFILKLEQEYDILSMDYNIVLDELSTENFFSDPKFLKYVI